jgi:HEAT repeat protein
MTIRLFRPVVGVFFLGLVGVTSLVARDRTTDEWLTLLGDEDREVRVAAVHGLGDWGGTGEAKKVAPALVDAFKKEKDARVRYEIAWALGKMGADAVAAVPELTAALADKEVAYRAAQALGEIGPAAKPAIPSLVAALAKPEITHVAAAALGKVGLDAMPALLDATKSKESIVRAGVAEALGELGARFLTSRVSAGGAGPAQKIVPILSALLKDADDDVRYRTAAALKALGAQAAPAVPVLVAALKDKKRDVRNQSAQALGRIGSAAVPALVEAVADKDACAWALKALASIGGNAKESVAVVVKALASDNADIRYEAIWVLAGLGADAQSGVPALEKIAKEDASPVNRSRATRALAAIKPPKKEEKKDEK